MVSGDPDLRQGAIRVWPRECVVLDELSLAFRPEFCYFWSNLHDLHGFRGPVGHEVVAAGHRNYQLKEQSFQPAEAFYNFHSVTER